ncbi:MAG: hypothetical protein EA356_09470 [Geminicoccaceae bacterium]|nr:MAG: hypothetical protein EA356_09470 [Geminicoccaceae bacterium]
MTRHLDTEAAAVDWLLATVGRDLRVALPLGLGKPVGLINELTRRACADPTIRLEIFTALTLERPRPSSDMEKRFLGPALDRLFGAYPQIDYARLLREDRLPENIRVTEFFLQASNWLGVAPVQQAYVAANYTHAFDLLLAQRPNVALQLVAAEGDALSLSCNTDISSDLLAARRGGAADFTFVAQVHPDLPFMPGPAEITPADCDGLLRTDGKPHDLFSLVKRPVGLEEHAMALHASRLIPDGGTLQIGIGEIGDALAHALLLRERAQIAPIWQNCPFAQSPAFAETGRFEAGLYAVTEMLVDGLLALFEAGIVRREVDGTAIHAGFFVDSRDFYARLRALPPAQRAKIAMVPVSFTNALYGDEAAKRAARCHARFVNSAMMVTLLGAAVSDGRDDGQVVSGVGGQFNFFEQAFALDGARCILTLPATREGSAGLNSNLRWNYGNTTIPRHYRDVVVTEYGIADLRGKSDAETIAALLQIADSRFQGELEDAAKSAGKLPASWRLPETARRNTPEALQAWLSPHRDELLPSFPFGTDFTEIERRLLPALGKLRSALKRKPELLKLVLGGWFGHPVAQEDEALERLDLTHPAGIRERLSARALRGALRKTA